MHITYDYILLSRQVVGIILGITLCCQLTSKTRRYTY